MGLEVLLLKGWIQQDPVDRLVHLLDGGRRDTAGSKHANPKPWAHPQTLFLHAVDVREVRRPALSDNGNGLEFPLLNPLVDEPIGQHCGLDVSRHQSGHHCSASLGVGDVIDPRVQRAVGLSKIQVSRAPDAECSPVELSGIGRIELGATLAIDYHREDFVQAVDAATHGRGVDVILDMVAGDYVARDISAVATDGRVVFISFLGGRHVQFDVMAVMQKRVTLTGSTLRASSSAFKQSIALELAEYIWPKIEAGAICPVTDGVFELSEVADAHRLMESGRQIGKILIRMPIH